MLPPLSSHPRLFQVPSLSPVQGGSFKSLISRDMRYPLNSIVSRCGNPPLVHIGPYILNMHKFSSCIPSPLMISLAGTLHLHREIYLSERQIRTRGFRFRSPRAVSRPNRRHLQ
jgi:hypothetical protein